MASTAKRLLYNIVENNKPKFFSLNWNSAFYPLIWTAQENGRCSFRPISVDFPKLAMWILNHFHQISTTVQRHLRGSATRNTDTRLERTQIVLWGSESMCASCFSKVCFFSNWLFIAQQHSQNSLLLTTSQCSLYARTNYRPKWSVILTDFS